MYTRFYPDASDTKVPQNYDGNAFRESENLEKRDTGHTLNEEAEQVSFFEPIEKDEANEKRGDGILASLNKIPFLSGIIGKGGALPFSKLSLPKIGSEEILIIAAAAYLFFSKEGDKECAVMLLLLLLIN